MLLIVCDKVDVISNCRLNVLDRSTHGESLFCSISILHHRIEGWPSMNQWHQLWLISNIINDGHSIRLIKRHSIWLLADKVMLLHDWRLWAAYHFAMLLLRPVHGALHAQVGIHTMLLLLLLQVDWHRRLAAATR